MDDFAHFTPATTPTDYLNRELLRGLDARQVADEFMARQARVRPVKPITADRKRGVLENILKTMGRRGWHISSLTKENVALYREYLRVRVQNGKITETTASGIAKVWNSVMRLAFDDATAKSLLMQGFSQHVRLIDPLTAEEMGRVLACLERVKFGNQHDRTLMRTYLRLQWCAGARIGSFLRGRLAAKDVDVAGRSVLLRHMKMGGTHTFVLSDDGAQAVDSWMHYLEATPHWVGPETPLFIHLDGRLTQAAWINRALIRILAVAGVQKHITTHGLRKSVGTLAGNINPRLAARQLGNDPKTFLRTYYQPSLQDLKNHRGFLPGFGEGSQ